MIGPSRKGAEKVIAKKKAEIAEDKFPDKSKELPPIKFHNFAKEYLEWARANNKSSSHRNKLYCLRVLDKEFGDRKSPRSQRGRLRSGKRRGKRCNPGGRSRSGLTGSTENWLP